jgi:hypothetical protein
MYSTFLFFFSSYNIDILGIYDLIPFLYFIYLPVIYFYLCALFTENKKKTENENEFIHIVTGFY